MVTSKPHWPRIGEKSEVPPVELSTNPVLRQAFSDVLDNKVGSRVFAAVEGELVIETLPESSSGQGAHSDGAVRDRAIQRALALLLFVQVPAAVLSFGVSPSVEWELIACCAFGLVMLKVFAAKQPSLLSVAACAITANALMGALVGEVLHFACELSGPVADLPYAAATAVALVFAASFYACLIGDVLFVKRAQRMSLSVTERDGRIVVTERLAPLGDRDCWWLTWGISAGSVWAPFHAAYLVSRLVDWITAGILLDCVWGLVFNRRYRR